MENTSKLVKNFKLGKCEIAVFENEQQGKDGKHPYSSFSFKVQKSYFVVESNEWKSSSSFNRQELLQLIPLIIKTINEIETK